MTTQTTTTTEILFNSQIEAIQHADRRMKALGIQILYPEHAWTEKIGVGDTTIYHFPLNDAEGSLRTELLHLAITRMADDSFYMTTYLD